MSVRKLTDADKAVDFTEAIQGHVSQTTKQVFTEERSRNLHNRWLQLECREHIVKDQFGNLYVVFAAKLLDGELYAVTSWIAHPHRGLVKQYRKLGFRRFDDDLLAYLQNEAWVALGRATVAILQARQAAKLPMAYAGPAVHA
jgi:hypothetical protein